MNTTTKYLIIATVAAMFAGNVSAESDDWRSSEIHDAWGFGDDDRDDSDDSDDYKDFDNSGDVVSSDEIEKAGPRENLR